MTTKDDLPSSLRSSSHAADTAGPDGGSIASSTSSVRAGLDQDQQNTLRRYHSALGQELRPGGVELRNYRFRTNFKVVEGSSLWLAMDIVLRAHQERVAGKGSPAACDDALREALP